MGRYAISIKYGVIAGAIMIGIILLIYTGGAAKLAGMLPVLAYIPLIFFMIWGGVTARRKVGQFEGFRQAFLTVFIISFTANALFNTFNYVLFKVVDPTIPQIMKQKEIEALSDFMEKKGTIDADSERQLKELKEQDPSATVQGLLRNYLVWAVIGAIFSALIGLFVNRPDERPHIKAEE